MWNISKRQKQWKKKIKWGANNRKNRFKNKYTVISQAKQEKKT